MCIIAELLILRAAFAPPRDAGAAVPVPQSPRGTEMIWAIIPAIVLAVLLAATWRAIH
jgi:heme/copper-type cytochrome/quinol oxidase subunit 2